MGRSAPSPQGRMECREHDDLAPDGGAGRSKLSGCSVELAEFEHKTGCLLQISFYT